MSQFNDAMAKRFVGLQKLADEVNRQSRATRYRFDALDAFGLKVLYHGLKAIRCGQRDTVYRALCEHLAGDDYKRAARRAAARRRKSREQ